MTELETTPLYPGDAAGPILKLTAPVSFWGSVDPNSGTVADPRHPDHGASIRDRVLAIPSAVGSSSSSAIMLELLRQGAAPSAIVLSGDDAILALGVIVARELGYPTIPVVRVSASDFARLPSDGQVVLSGNRLTFRSGNER